MNISTIKKCNEVVGYMKETNESIIATFKIMLEPLHFGSLTLERYEPFTIYSYNSLTNNFQVTDKFCGYQGIDERKYLSADELSSFLYQNRNNLQTI